MVFFKLSTCILLQPALAIQDKRHIFGVVDIPGAGKSDKYSGHADCEESLYDWVDGFGYGIQQCSQDQVYVAGYNTTYPSADPTINASLDTQGCESRIYDTDKFNKFFKISWAAIESMMSKSGLNVEDKTSVYLPNATRLEGENRVPDDHGRLLWKKADCGIDGATCNGWCKGLIEDNEEGTTPGPDDVMGYMLWQRFTDYYECRVFKVDGVQSYRDDNRLARSCTLSDINSGINIRFRRRRFDQDKKAIADTETAKCDYVQFNKNSMEWKQELVDRNNSPDCTGHRSSSTNTTAAQVIFYIFLILMVLLLLYGLFLCCVLCGLIPLETLPVWMLSCLNVTRSQLVG